MTPSPTTPQGSEPREDGWIEWTGGENPVPGARVDVRCRNGMVMEDCGDVSWSHPAFAEQLGSGPPSQGDIIAYRVVSPAHAAPTNGGGGEPTVLISALIAAKYDKVAYAEYLVGSPAERNKTGRLQGLNDALAIAMVAEEQAALQPQPTQQGGAEVREKIAKMLHAEFGRFTENWTRAPQEQWLKKADRILAALKTEKA